MILVRIKCQPRSTASFIVVKSMQYLSINFKGKLVCCRGCNINKSNKKEILHFSNNVQFINFDSKKKIAASACFTSIWYELISSKETDKKLLR